MPYLIAFGFPVGTIGTVSAAIERVTRSSREGRESSYLGVYDLFHFPESMKVKYNYVEEERDWDYPEFKDSSVIIVVEETERPEFFESMVAQLGIQSTVIERKHW